MTIVRTDPNLPVDTNWAHAVCNIGQGAACCRYLTMAPGGFSCEKGVGDMALYLDQRVAEGTIVSRGDNCTGRMAR